MYRQKHHVPTYVHANTALNNHSNSCARIATLHEISMTFVDSYGTVLSVCINWSGPVDSTDYWTLCTAHYDGVIVVLSSFNRQSCGVWNVCLKVFCFD